MFESRRARLFNRGASPLGLPYTLSRSLLRHARSVRVAHSLRSFALSPAHRHLRPDGSPSTSSDVLRM